MTVSFLIVERICEVASTGAVDELKPLMIQPHSPSDRIMEEFEWRLSYYVRRATTLNQSSLNSCSEAEKEERRSAT